MLKHSRALFFLLYFNRVLASLLSLALRTWTWHRYGIYIDVKAVQVSLLGGRVFFVGLRYHGNNETILIQNGYVTWAYWLRRVRHTDLGKRRTGKEADAEGTNGDRMRSHDKSKSRIPCRLEVTLAGLEWIVYNRSAAYDSILAGLAEPNDASEDEPQYPASREQPSRPSEEGLHKLRKRRGRHSADGAKGEESNDDTAEKTVPFTDVSSRGQRVSGRRVQSSSMSEDGDRKADAEDGEADSEENALPPFLNFFPLSFTCDRAAVVMGNENTSGILIVKTQLLSGEIDAMHTDTPDPYRQVFRLRFKDPVVEMRENEDYREDQASKAIRERQIAQETEPLSPHAFFRHKRRAAYSRLRNLAPYFQKSVESFSSTDSRSPPATATSARIPGSLHWKGLSRYLDGPGGDEKTRWEGTEYAMLNPLLESPEAFLTIYWDSTGKVTASAIEDARNVADSSDGNERPVDRRLKINGTEPPPAWGMSLSVRGGSVNYGPWADRKRAELQRVFFPGLSKDARPAKQLPVGASRMPTQFKVFVELDDEVTLRVPTREASKNWRFGGKDMGTKFQPPRDKRRNRSRYKKSEPAPSASGPRPYGWLDIKIARNATVSYSMDMMATTAGFCATLDVDLPRVEISSSVNQQILWRSGPIRIACDLSTPLKWNALRQWRFHITSNDLELFVLRDHVFLLTDLIDDWSTGPPADYLVYTPFKYFIDLSFPHVKIYLNVNDANIINNPTSFDDNTFVILSSPLLESSVCIPLDRFRPPSNAIPFNVRADAVAIKLHVPPWNTQSMFVQTKDVGHVNNVVVDGKYHYHAATATNNSDSLLVDMSGKKPVFRAYGFMVRYFLKLKDNYFGDDVHFKTLEEYQDNLRLKEADPDAELASRPPHKLSNDLDVILHVDVEEPKMLLPAYIYSTSRHIQIDAAALSADLRFTNYYMDLDTVLSPLSLSLGTEDGANIENPGGEGPARSLSNTQLFIDGVHVYGSRLFGLPPTEPTYLCNWDLSFGAISGECTADFLTALANGGKAFGSTFDDDENALVPYHMILMYDVTFLRVFVKSISIWLHVGEAAFLLSLGEGASVNYNDWARKHYSKRADISIPDLQVSCVNSDSAMRHKSRRSSPVETGALLKTGLSIAAITRKFDFSKERALQQELVRREDQRTQRAAFLILPSLAEAALMPDQVEPPAQPVPPLPLPVTTSSIDRDGLSLSSQSASLYSKRRLRHQKSQRSFLSFSSSSQASIVRPRSSVHNGSARSQQSSAYPRGRHDLQPLTPAGLSAGASGHVSSSARYSGFYGSDETSRHPDPNHNTVTFSSKYFTPYFPLEDVKPDISEATAWGADKRYGPSHISGEYEKRGGSVSGSDPDSLEPADFGLDDVDPDALSERKLHSSILIRFDQDVSAFINAESTRYIAALISALQPHGPEEILDSVQIASTDSIVHALKQRKMEGHIGDFAVQLPHANFRFLNAASPSSPSGASEEQDQYDVSVSGITLMSRTKTTWTDAMQPEESQVHNSFQLRLGSIELSASERLANIGTLQAACMGSIEKVLVSMGTKDLTYLDADIGAVQGKLSSEKIEYIASLIHRTGVLASNLTEAFAAPLSYSGRVRPHLAQRLIAAGNGVNDPSFLVRPSAVLRSAHEHFRTFDSWKLAVRLRQIWFLMKRKPKEQLIQECLEDTPLLPVVESPIAPVFVAPIGSTVRDVITKLEDWRGWDLGDLTRSPFLQELFSTLKRDLQRVAAAKRPALTSMCVVRLERLQLMLDPGPKQNEIAFFDLTVRLEGADSGPFLTSPPPLSAGGDGDRLIEMAAASPALKLNVFCSDSAVRLNWEICELAQDVIRLYKWRMAEQASANMEGGELELAAEHGRNGPNTKSVKAASNSGLKMVHVVCAMDHSSIVLDTINLNVRMVGEGMKGSLLMSHGAKQVTYTNLMISSDSISSKVKSHSEPIVSSQLKRPSVFVAHTMLTSRNRFEHSIKATASSRDFSFGVKQNPLALLETLDLLVRDEVAQLRQFGEQFPLTPDKPLPQSPVQPKTKEASVNIVERLSTISFKVALFLENYTISLPLLRSLSYKISGVVARVAFSANFAKEMVIDFDVKENSHDMQVTVNNAPRSISLLQIPPTNGKVTIRIGDDEQTVTVFSSLELVQLDAAAVYALLSALNRPEISNTVTEMQQQLNVTQKHLNEIFDNDSDKNQRLSAKPKSLSKPVVYSIHSTFAGLEIFGNVSLKSDAQPMAHLSFCLDSIHLEMMNRVDNYGPLLEYPELHINLRRVAFEILKGSEGNMASCGSMAFAALITATSRLGEDGSENRSFGIKSDAFDLTLSPDTVSTVVDVLGYMGDKIKDLDTSREIEYLRKLRQSRPRIVINDQEQPEDDDDESDIINSFLSSIAYSLEIRNIRVNWLCALEALESRASRTSPLLPGAKEDLVLLLGRIELGTRTKNSARLTIENLQIQMVPPTHDKTARSANSALLPELVFNVAYFSTSRTRRFAFQAVGKSLDLRLTSEFIVPAAHLNDSIQLSIKNVQQVSTRWNPMTNAQSNKPVSAPSTRCSSPSKLSSSQEKQPILGNKRLESLLVDLDFAGAVVFITGKGAGPSPGEYSPAAAVFGAPGDSGSSSRRRTGIGGKYGQFSSDESGGSTTLRSPGLTWKLEYRDSGRGDPSLYAEVKIEPSSNVIYPSVVPLIMDITAGIKDVVSSSGRVPKMLQDLQDNSDGQGSRPGADDTPGDAGAVVAKPRTEESILLSAANPQAMLGRLNLNLGVRIHKQQFTLSCQPIARVAATTSFDDVYLTMNTIRTIEHGNFVAVSGNISGFQASVQHMYSRESTGSFEVDSIVLSLMNSKHVSGVSGVSALLKVSPMKVAINVRQVQDFLLFREIWMPREIRRANTAPIVASLATEATSTSATSSSQQQQPIHLVQRYQQVAATAAFPWTASVSIAALEINVDLGQALGKPIFAIENFWVSSRKTSGWEQNLCLGFRRIGIDSTGRMSGFIALEDFKLRTSIEWPQREQALSKTPLVQASISFSQLRIKASFDYQAFLVADIQSLDFLMYNVRRGPNGRGDRLVAIFEGDAVQVFGTTTSAAQSVALYQAFQRLLQERRANFEAALRDIEKFTTRRPSSTVAQPSGSGLFSGMAKVATAVAIDATGGTAVLELSKIADDDDSIYAKSPISLDTDVVVTLRAVNLGVFPNTFTDHQVFKMEALNAQARFVANIRDGRIHSNLGLTLGQLRIGLAGVRHIPTMTDTPNGLPKTVSELSVEDVVLSATGSRGGTILKVPRVEASMQTWQLPDSKQIDYIFKSAFEGKVEVGWNYSRVSYIRGMWANHSRTLEQTWGREIPLAAIRVTGVPEGAADAGERAAGTAADKKNSEDAQTKITAEVHVPQSKYRYNALEPPVIETPQLRDMGEATPPLEWIGLHRDRLPNLTHQIVIVSLLELAGEVEDAYSRILGSS